MLEKILEGLKNTKTLLSDHDRWAKQAFAYNAEHRIVDSTDSAAVRWCLVGATIKSTHETYGVMFPTLTVLAEAVAQCGTQGWCGYSPSDKITQFNDDEMTSHHHVLEALDAAITRVEAMLEREGKDDA